MLRLLLLFWVVVCVLSASAQEKNSIAVIITNTHRQPLTGATVQLLKQDSSLLNTAITDTAGIVHFISTGLANYVVRVSMVNYRPAAASIAADGKLQTIILRAAEETLQTITVEGKKPPVELRTDRTVINVEASVTNAGTTLLELLEKQVGVTVDANGNITLKGKANVMVKIDGKPAYVSGGDLANLLSGMSSSQVSQIELIDNPSADTDASGSGVINIKTKKGLQKGFNGSVSTTANQGHYPRTVNNLSLNWRTGKVNSFLSYNLNTTENFLKSNVSRTYFKSDGTVKSLLDQSALATFGNTVHNLSTGVDFTPSANTNISLALTGNWSDRTRKGNNTASWKNAAGGVDSVVTTTSSQSQNYQHKRGTLSFSHRFGLQRELKAEVDLVSFHYPENQYFENKALSYTEAYRGAIPSDVDIVASQVDYNEKKENVRWAAGVKTSYTKIENLADYSYSYNYGPWINDAGKTNHFFYRQNIHALYTEAESKWNRWTAQGGLRFEYTDYNTRQLYPKDSSFSRRYGSFFPSLSVSFEKDSANTFAFAAGQRINRPDYRLFNPFVIIYNKYTYEQGNPYLLPQYVWNAEFSHSYKNTLLSSIGYSLTTDYIMEVYPVAPNGIVTYTYGNLGRLQNVNASVGLQKEATKWWSFLLQAQAIYKHFKGVVLNEEKTVSYTQYRINLSNTFRFGKSWTGDVSGYYNSSRKEFIQELLKPDGQLNVGVAKNFAQGKGTVKFSLRDLFYTSWFKGVTEFSGSTETFKQTRDSRYASLSFSWRFGKAYKTPKRSEGAGSDEIQRAGGRND